MELSTFWAALLRRWYLLVVAILLAAAASYGVVDRIGPTYQLHATVLLFPPTTTIENSVGSVTEGNPYLYLSGLNQPRDILIGTMTSQGVRNRILAQAPAADYQMSPDIGSSGPVIAVDVTAESESDAKLILREVLEYVPTGLERMQEGLPISDEAKITSRVIAADTQAEVIRKAQIRGAIVAAAATVGASLLFIGLFDGLRNSRRARQLASRRAGDDKSRRKPRRARKRHSDAGAPVANALQDDRPNRLQSSKGAKPGAGPDESLMTKGQDRAPEPEVDGITVRARL